MRIAYSLVLTCGIDKFAYSCRLNPKMQLSNARWSITRIYNTNEDDRILTDSGKVTKYNKL